MASAAASTDASQSAPMRGECAVRHPAGCRNTNQLVLAPDFQNAVRKFGGGAQIAVLGRGEEPLWTVLLTTLHGPPDEPISLSDGSYLFTACMAHSCTEKGAIVVTRSGSITMAATLTNHFAREDSRSKLSEAHYARLDIYLAGAASAAPSWRQAVRAWAKAAYATDGSYFREVFQTYSTGLSEYRWLVLVNSPTLIPVGRSRIK